MKTQIRVQANPYARCRILCGIAVTVATVLCANRAVAQLDTEPTNGVAGAADVLSLNSGAAISNLAGLRVGGNDVDFYSTLLTTGDVLFGMTTPLGDLPTTFDVPDTVAGVFSGGVPQTYNDDDGADSFPAIGFNFGSLFRFQAPGSGTYHVGVTGTGDEEFDGAASGDEHFESGSYMLTVGRVNPAVLGGDFSDTDPLNDGIFPMPPPPFPGRPGPFAPDAIAVAPFTAQVSVAELLANDVDYFKLELKAGWVLSAMTAPLGDLSSTFDVPDTILGLFNSAGVKIFENDDAGNELESVLNDNLASDSPFEPSEIRGSALRALIPTDGTYYLAVSGFSDDLYVGSHGESGRYALLVGTIPEPGSLVLIGLGLVGLLGVSRRRGR